MEGGEILQCGVFYQQEEKTQAVYRPTHMLSNLTEHICVLPFKTPNQTYMLIIEIYIYVFNYMHKSHILEDIFSLLTLNAQVKYD